MGHRHDLSTEAFHNLHVDLANVPSSDNTNGLITNFPTNCWGPTKVTISNLFIHYFGLPKNPGSLNCRMFGNGYLIPIPEFVKSRKNFF